MKRKPTDSEEIPQSAGISCLQAGEDVNSQNMGLIDPVTDMPDPITTPWEETRRWVLRTIEFPLTEIERSKSH